MLLAKKKLIRSLFNIPRDGLIGEWLLNGNALDTSGYGNHGTVVGATLVTGRKGIPNTAYNMTASEDRISIGDFLDMGLLDMSISAWCNITAYILTNIIVAKTASNPELGSYSLGLNFGTPYKYRGVFSPSSSPKIVLSNLAFASGWHHIVQVYDRDNSIYMYVDGVLQTASTSIAAYSAYNMNNNKELTIGNAHLGAFPLNGSISEVRIYNRVLSSEDVNLLYNE